MRKCSRTLFGSVRTEVGFTLIEVLIAASLTVVVMMGVASMYSAQQRNVVNNQTVMTRNFLQIQLDRYLADEHALARTLAYTGTGGAGNVALANCYSPSGAVCQQTSSQGFVLLDATGAIISGTSSSPARYDYTGKSCTTPNAACLFEVFTEFKSTCPNPPGTTPCSAPDVLSATYTIRQSPNVKKPVGGVDIKAASRTFPFAIGSSGSYKPIYKCPLMYSYDCNDSDVCHTTCLGQLQMGATCAYRGNAGYAVIQNCDQVGLLKPGAGSPVYSCPLIPSTDCSNTVQCESTCNGQLQLGNTCGYRTAGAILNTKNCTLVGNLDPAGTLNVYSCPVQMSLMCADADDCDSSCIGQLQMGNGCVSKGNGGVPSPFPFVLCPLAGKIHSI